MTLERVMVRRLPAALALAILVLAAGGLEGHADGELEVRIERFVESPETVSLTLSVLDASGNSVSSLDASSVLVLDGGERLPAQLVATEGADIGVATFLGLDVSGSMEGALDDARTGVRLLLDTMRPIDSAALVAFSDEVSVVAELGTSPQRLRAGLDALQARGGTHLYDATRQLAASASAHPSERKVVILLSDGRDEGSTTAREGALAAAVASGVPFYVVAMGNDVDTAFLERLADDTGGVFLRAATSSGLVPAYDAITRRLRTQYVLTVQPRAAEAVEERVLNIVVTTAAGSGSVERAYQRSAAPLSASAVVMGEAAATVAEPPSPMLPSTESPTFDVRVVLVGGALVAFALVVWRRRRRLAPVEEPVLAARARPASRRSEGVALLRPLDGEGEPSVPLRGEVMSVDASGEVRAGPLEPRRTGAQLWWRDGRLMLHRVGDAGAGLTAWSSAVPGDVLELGGRRFRLELESTE